MQEKLGIFREELARRGFHFRMPQEIVRLYLSLPELDFKVLSIKELKLKGTASIGSAIPTLQQPST